MNRAKITPFEYGELYSERRLAMTTINTLNTMTEAPETFQERRSDHRLREMLDEAYTLIAPFFDPANSWGGQTLEFLAFRVMRENYPQVSREEVLTFISAAKRIYAERRTRG